MKNKSTGVLQICTFWKVVFVLLVVCLLQNGSTVDGKARIKRKKKKKGLPLFDANHPNITYLTDKNYKKLVLDSKKPWLIDFYHPFCPHCKHFVPDWKKIAAYYKAKGTINIGAISCMDHLKCRRVKINGFPTLMAIGFDPKFPGKENKRIIGTHTLQEVIDFSNKIFAEIKNGTSSGTSKPSTKTTAAPKLKKPGERKRKGFWEETKVLSTEESRIRDAASAFIFGLKQGIFIGREVLEDLQLDALKEWLRVVSISFPGEFNRQLISQLYRNVSSVAFLTNDKWEGMVSTWQEATLIQFNRLNETFHKIPGWANLRSWQLIPDLFDGDGNEYDKCALYTCGQWTMFHMMTINPVGNMMRTDNDIVSVIAGIRRFMKYFFGCVQCKDHFLAYNTLEKVKEIHTSPNKPTKIKLWLWKMHNAVNKRIHHPQWPKPNVCPECGKPGNWNEENVKVWLTEQFGYQDIMADLIHDSQKEKKVIYAKRLNLREKMTINDTGIWYPFAVVFMMLVACILGRNSKYLHPLWSKLAYYCRKAFPCNALPNSYSRVKTQYQNVCEV